MKSKNNYSKTYDDICCICTEDDYDNSNIINFKSYYITKCNHNFHYGCIKNWCIHNNSCPICREDNILSSTILNSCIWPPCGQYSCPYGM